MKIPPGRGIASAVTTVVCAVTANRPVMPAGAPEEPAAPATVALSAGKQTTASVPQRTIDRWKKKDISVTASSPWSPHLGAFFN